MNGKQADFFLRLKGNPYLRFFLYPVMKCRVFITKMKYILSGDNKKIKKYRKVHEGERCFIIGNGPSLLVEDLELLNDEITIGMNRIFNIFLRTSWRPRYYIAVDEEFIRSEIKNIKAIPGDVFIKNMDIVKRNLKGKNNVVPIFINSPTPIKNYNFKKKYISENLEDGFSLNYSVACYAIELAIYMGFKEIYLIGIDHCFPKEIKANGKTKQRDMKEHFDGGSYKDGNVSYYIDSVTSCFEMYEKYSKDKGIRIVNCTRGGKLEVYERKAINEVKNHNV